MPLTSPTLYDPAYEHGSCGLGFVARVDGRRSHEIVEQGLEVLTNLAHRGATGSDAETGDGAGLLVQIPDAFFRRECKFLGFELPRRGCYGVGMLFLPQDREARTGCEQEFERIVREEGQHILGWRDVPTEPSTIGMSARAVVPCIRQMFIGRTPAQRESAFERKLYVIRRRLHHVRHDCYIVSLSARTVVYKGLLRGPQVASFYSDLRNSRVTSALALVHSRFSTNTLGSWQLAHPYRYVAHNGEINTLRGNVNWMRAREMQLASALFGEDINKLRPIVEPHVSDSASFDNALELLVLGGRSLPHAMMMMIPEAWENDGQMEAERRAFYQFHGSLMEPWDGPAAVAFTDGRVIGATLDRNGLRPARYSVTRDGLVVLASEEGVLPIHPEDVVSRSRLQPGKMFVVDTEKHQVLADDEIKTSIIGRRPYRRWVEQGTTVLDQIPQPPAPVETPRATTLEQQKTFGYTLEDLKMVIAPMAATGKEPDSSMGTDTPLAILSERSQLLFSYFQQLFAQVTNPPIDPLRERLVMSLKMSLGPEMNLLDEGPRHCRRIMLEQPILTSVELEKLRQINTPPFRAVTLSMFFPRVEGEAGLEPALDDLCRRAEAAIDNGATILILSDREMDFEHAPIPSLLATSAVHHHLVRQGIRTRAGLVVETGDAREVHHFALLIGFGAVAVHPYLAFDVISAMVDSGDDRVRDRDRAIGNYVKAIDNGLLKVISKMGISTLFSYCGAQIFEAVGLDQALIDRHFTGVASRIGGLTLTGLAREVLERHDQAFAAAASDPIDLEIGGNYQMRPQGEYHQWNTDSIVSLQRAVRAPNFATFKDFTRHFDETSAKLSTLRGLFQLKTQEEPIPLSEVESAEDIVRRFSSGAMSFGSLSREAHETLAIALNRIGGKSNTGEGGEDLGRSRRDSNGDLRRSAIKQVASARFGVTTHYLVDADVLQIKMAQGSKPGEGGQLPGDKVSEDIAQVRYSTPGVTLISPPPHHDIYSIEDLAQLIHDLKNVNPQAQISVKLVSEVGVGTIAAGVVKAKADHITISGYDGGTGASPLSSIKHAGLPWELGLAETHQTLVRNGLRDRVYLQCDGHLKTGRDVVIAALLGAEEFAFSTAPLIAMGCLMMRACHLNTCPVGIATQNPELRKKFAGTAENVVNYFFFLAEEMRELMAALGFRCVQDMIGRSDMIEARRETNHWKTRELNLSAMLASTGATFSHTTQEHGLADSLDVQLIDQCRDALDDKRQVNIGGDPERALPIRNVNRSVGAMLSGEIVRRFGAEGLADDTIQIHFDGTAGQSFGAWTARGLTLILSGETNDYTGKGLSGGKLVVAPGRNAGYEPERSIAVGNVALYGATGGEAYFRGVGGERFAIRNSGALAVVEGVGDHGCEYMTGGVVLVLGGTGRNFAAGMSGGIAFVLDMWGRFAQMCNQDMVGLEQVVDQDDVHLVRRLLSNHVRWTGSTTAQRVLTYWSEYLPRLVKVMPHDLRTVLDKRDSGRSDLPEARAV